MYYPSCHFFFWALLLISVSIAKSTNSECNIGEPKDPCSGDDPDFPPTKTNQIVDDDGSEHCFFVAPEDTNFLKNITVEGATINSYRINMTFAREQCAKYGARLPQLTTKKTYKALCREGREDMDNFFKDIEAVPLGMVSWEASPIDDDTHRHYVDVAWDSGVNATYISRDMHNLSVEGDPCGGHWWWYPLKKGITTINLFDAEWTSRDMKNNTISVPMKLICHLNFSDIVVDPRCIGGGGGQTSGDRVTASITDSITDVAAPTSGSVRYTAACSLPIALAWVTL